MSIATITTTYDELYALVTDQVKHYRTDLTEHDQRMLEENPGVPFLHCARECGTFMQLLHEADSDYWPAKGTEIPYLFGHADREHILSQILPVIRGCWKQDANDRTIRYYNGVTTKLITHRQALEIAQDYVYGIGRQWIR